MNNLIPIFTECKSHEMRAFSFTDVYVLRARLLIGIIELFLDFATSRYFSELHRNFLELELQVFCAAGFSFFPFFPLQMHLVMCGFQICVQQIAY